MANANRPQGFMPVSTLSGADYQGKFSLYYVQASDTSALFVGDAVVSVPGSADAVVLGQYESGLQLVTKAPGGAGVGVRGVVVGFIPDPIDLGLQSLPATKTKGYLVQVCDDPQVIFKLVGDNTGAVSNTAIGSYANFSVTSPSTAYSVSNEVLLTSTIAANAALPLRVLGLHRGDLTAYCHFLVCFNLHELG